MGADHFRFKRNHVIFFMQGVVFDPPSVVFPPTYITDVSRFAVKVENTSDDIHKISLFSYASTKQDVFEINFMPESPRFSHRDFLFKHETFSIEPLEFELFPHSSTVIIVEFHPGVASKYEVPAYIQIDEREKRKPFRSLESACRLLRTLFRRLSLSEISIWIVSMSMRSC